MDKYFFKKKFSQNFLTDKKQINDIYRFINPQLYDKFLEIGPGLGVLTNILIRNVCSMHAIEIDRDLSIYLKKKFEDYRNFTLYNADILNFNLRLAASSNCKLRVVGNLPYNISSQIIFHIIGFNGIIKDIFFMFQKEFADRLVAVTNCKAYSYLSVIVQYHYKINILSSIHPDSFTPSPKVMSSFIKMVPVSNDLGLLDYNLFKMIVFKSFTCRRKKIKNILKRYYDAKELISIGIDPSYRAENLSIQNFITLSNFYYNKNNFI